MKRQKRGQGLYVLMKCTARQAHNPAGAGSQVQILSPQLISVAPQRPKPLAFSGFLLSLARFLVSAPVGSQQVALGRITK